MEQSEEIERATTTSENPINAPALITSARGPIVGPLPQQPCPTCGGVPAIGGTSGVAPRYVYAIGRIRPRFPRLSVEKEFAQVTSHSDTAGLSDSRVLQTVLSKKENRYLVRQLCWVLSIEGLETYLLYPRDPVDFEMLTAALRATPSPVDLDVVIGARGPIASPEVCNGLMVPIVIFDQIYSFDRDALIKAIPRPKKYSKEEFAPAAAELFDRIMQLTDNAGSTDEHRALNYLTVRYPAIYTNVAEAFQRDVSLSAVETRPSALSGTRQIVEVIFAYTHRRTDVTEKFFTRVDVTEEFPFLVTKISPYYDRNI